MRDLARSLRADGFANEWWWTTEVGKKTGMIHIHALQHGDYIPRLTIQKKWGSIVDIRTAQGTSLAVARYMAKDASGVAAYMAKHAQSGYAQWVELNGGRPFHQSRGFHLGLGIEFCAREYNRAVVDHCPPDWVRLSVLDAEEWWSIRHAAGGDRLLFSYLLSQSVVFGSKGYGSPKDERHICGDNL
jgi:hypothetical protein